MELSPRQLVMTAVVLGACAAAGCSVAYAAGSYLHRVFSMDAHVPCLVHHLATSDECAALIAEAEGAGLKRSTVAHDNEPISTGRTSSHVFLESPTAETLKQRVSAFLGIPTAHFENVQVVRYNPGEKYDAHYDAAAKSSTSARELPRLYTVLVYLNDDYEGGHTAFPKCGAEVTPRQGMGVLWRNLSESGRILQSSYHAGLPVTRGTKYVATLWIHGSPPNP